MGRGEDDVEIQVAGLKGETVKNSEDDVDLDELLAELNLKEETWKIDGEVDGVGDEEKGITSLLAEARKALQEGKVGEEGEQMEGGKHGKEEDTGGGDDEDEEAAADEYIQQVMADIEIRRQQGILDSEDEEEGKEEEAPPKSKHHNDNNDDDTILPESPVEPGRREKESTPFDLIPSPPSTAPTPLPEEEQQQEQKIDPLTARLHALKPPSTLSLPQPPTSKPGLPSLKANPKPQDKKPQYTNEDIETWCAICTEDAVVRCLGCEGDLYCQECWDEGHRSKGAGLEERSHKAVLFSRDEKGKKKLVGAS